MPKHPIETTTVSLGHNEQFRTKSTYIAYYSEANARQVEGILKDFRDNPRELFISAEANKCSVRTLLNKLTYSFKWLAENGEAATKESYAKIRSSFKLVQGEGGIFIVPILAKLPILAQTATYNEIKKKNWLDTFTEWTKVAQDLEQFDSKAIFGKLTITDEQEQVLVKLCAQLNFEIDLHKSEGYFVAMK